MNFAIVASSVRKTLASSDQTTGKQACLYIQFAWCLMTGFLITQSISSFHADNRPEHLKSAQILQ